MSRSNLQPPETRPHQGCSRLCQTRTSGSGARPCSENSSLPGADHGVEAGVRGHERLGRQADLLHRQPGIPDTPQREPVHALGRVHAHDGAHARLVVEGHVQAGADADLKHPAMGQRDDLEALLAGRPGAARQVDEVGQDVALVPVLGHGVDFCQGRVVNAGDRAATLVTRRRPRGTARPNRSGPSTTRRGAPATRRSTCQW